MTGERIKQLLKKKEGIRLEFKESATDLPNDFFETVCAFLNRDGGEIILGADDDGKITGIQSGRIDVITANIVNLSNNNQKLNPPFILFPAKIEAGGKLLLYIQVPESSQVHRCSGIVYDRSNDGDFKVPEPDRIAELYNRKRTHFTEAKVYPYLTFNDLRADLFPKVRNLISSNKPDHPWLALDNEQMLVKAGLKRRDFQTGEEGYTLAAALLLGSDEVIQSILPHYKIDALVRRENLLRYDDRLEIRTNLVDAYEQLMGFVAKHLPDKFYMERDTRVSLRDKIFREVVANLLIHREYTNAHQASLVIYKDSVVTLNASNPKSHGLLTLTNFSPYPKNPAISRFFIQLGRAEELGSGMINVHRYLPHYTPGGAPEFSEGDLFKIAIPVPAKVDDSAIGGVSEGLNEGLSEGLSEGLNDAVNDAVSDAVNDAVKERLYGEVRMILTKGKMRLPEIIKSFEIERATAQRDMAILKESGVLEFKGSSKTGAYFLTENFKKKIKR